MIQQPQSVVSFGGSGCSISLGWKSRMARAATFAWGFTPAFVGIDDETRRRNRLPHRTHPFEIAILTQYQFEQWPGAIGGREVRHVSGCVEGDCEGRYDRRYREPGQFRGAAVSALRVDVPECAVERIARRARRHLRFAVSRG